MISVARLFDEKGQHTMSMDQHDHSRFPHVHISGEAEPEYPLFGESPELSEAARLVMEASQQGGFRIANVFDFAGQAPLEVPVAKAKATGHPFFTNGHLGVDMLFMPPDYAFPLHVHPGDHLLLILKGTGTVTYGGVVHPTKPGDIFMVPGMDEHAVGADLQGQWLLAFGAPHKPLHSPERMQVTE